MLLDIYPSCEVQRLCSRSLLSSRLYHLSPYESSTLCYDYLMHLDIYPSREVQHLCSCSHSPSLLYHLAPGQFLGFEYDILMLWKESQGWRKLILTTMQYQHLDDCS